jgi:hypothetical protein
MPTRGHAIRGASPPSPPQRCRREAQHSESLIPEGLCHCHGIVSQKLKREAIVVGTAVARAVERRNVHAEALATFFGPGDVHPAHCSTSAGAVGVSATRLP